VAAVEGWSGTSVLRARTPLNSRVTTPPTGSTAARELASPSSTSARSAGAVAAPAAASAVTTTPAAAPAKKSTPLFVGVGVVAIAAVAWFVTQGGEAAATADSTAVLAAAESSTVVPDARAKSVSTPPSVANAPRNEAAKTSKDSAISPAQTPAPVAAAEPGANAGVTSPDALQELESLRNLLADDNTGEAEARQAVPSIQRLVGRMGNATDSTWAYLTLVNANGQAGESLRACQALRSADKLATTAAQRQAITEMYASEALACVR
jgi:hypothetical protein